MKARRSTSSQRRLTAHNTRPGLKPGQHQTARPLDQDLGLLNDPHMSVAVRQEAAGRLNRSVSNAQLQRALAQPRQEPQRENSHHRIANDITSAFEGGKPASINTYDNGIVSYGKHQATLVSGSLYAVLKRYTQLSKSSVAGQIQGYLKQVEQKDPALRKEKPFLQLLKDAAGESAMAQAQDEVFSQKYWEPARKTAEKAGIKSALGQAIFYDTNIQGGLSTVLKRTQERLHGKPYTEQEFLSVFLEERRQRLLTLAEAKRKKGDLKTAAALENSAHSRVGSLKELAAAGDLDLRGQSGQISLGRYGKVAALKPGATAERAPGRPAAQSARPVAPASASGRPNPAPVAKPAELAPTLLETAQGVAAGVLETINDLGDWAIDLLGLTKTSQSAPPAPGVSELAEALAAGVRDEIKLTDTIFYLRHPDRRGKSIDPKQEHQLVAEWQAIRQDVRRSLGRAQTAPAKHPP